MAVSELNLHNSVLPIAPRPGCFRAASGSIVRALGVA